MNNNFNFERFGKYFLHDLKRQWKNIGMLMLIFALFPIIFYMIYMFFAALFDEGLVKLFTGGVLVGPPLWARFVVFACVTTIFVMLFPSRAYGEITDKAKGAEWLMLPASRLEKFISMMLMTLIIIPVLFIIVYFLSDSVVCLFDKSCGGSLASFRINDAINASEITFPANGFWILASMIVEYASIFLLGGLVFKKWKVVGTILVLFAISMVYSLSMSMFITSVDLESFGYWISEWCHRHADNLDLWLNGFINFFYILTIAICGTLSWYRIKRIQH